MMVVDGGGSVGLRWWVLKDDRKGGDDRSYNRGNDMSHAGRVRRGGKMMYGLKNVVLSFKMMDEVVHAIIVGIVIIVIRSSMSGLELTNIMIVGVFEFGRWRVVIGTAITGVESLRWTVQVGKIVTEGNL
jgi:hypothetical protein